MLQQLLPAVSSLSEPRSIGRYDPQILTLLAIWGWYADRHSSRRLPFLFGLVIIVAATILIWLSRTIALQFIRRVLQGLAAAIVWVTGLAMIADRVGEAEIGQYVGYLGTPMMVGTEEKLKPFLECLQLKCLV